MKGGKELLADIEAAHSKTQKEMVLGDTDKVLTSHLETVVKYNNDENKLAELETVARSAKDIILDEIPRKLLSYGSIEGYKKKIKGIEWKKIAGKLGADAEFSNEYWYLASNIWRFTDDAMCSGDEIAGLAIAIGQLLSDTEDEKVSEFIGTLASILSSDEMYKSALDKLDDIDLQDFNFDDEGGDDLEDLFGESLQEAKGKRRATAQSFKKGFKIYVNSQLRQIKKAGNIDKFNKLIDNIKGPKLASYMQGIWKSFKMIGLYLLKFQLQKGILRLICKKKA